MKDSLFWYIGDIARSLGRARARSLLIVLAVGAGTFACALMLGIRSGLDARARRLLADLGADTALLQLRREGISLLGESETDLLRHEFPGMVFSGERVRNYQIRGAGATPFLFADTRLSAIRPQLVREGRALDPGDERTAAPYAVVCQSLGLRPGALLHVEDHVLTVVGTAVLDGQVWVVPRLRLESGVQEEPFDQLRLRGPEITAVGARVRQLHPGGRLTVSTPEQLLRETRRWQRLVLGGFGSIAGLFFLLGGAALMSVMMLSVQQRRAEIGLRLALGANENNIFALFFGEGLFLSLLAGLLGAGAAVWVVSLPVFPAELPFQLHARTALLPVLFSVLVGGLFAGGPALHAAGQSPAAVLRPE